MIREDTEPWQERGARASTRAERPGQFIDEHLSPLFFRITNEGHSQHDGKDIVSDEQFWGEDSHVLFGTVQLNGFRLTDWFPRAPGVYWSRHAQRARHSVYSGESHSDAELGKYFSPGGKLDLIEEGGIGTIRLRPRRIDGETCWLSTALSGDQCHAGIPLAIPDSLLRNAAVNWGDRVNIRGRVRFLQDAGLDDTASRVHHARPLIVFVDTLLGVVTRLSRDQIIISPVALFESIRSHSDSDYFDRAQYTFVQCASGSDSELDAAVHWIEKYTTKHAGRVITNFDEQRPVLADAPLSYQRLVAKTYDRAIIRHFGGSIHVDHIDQFVQQSVVTQNFGGVHVGHNIEVGGSAIINIDSVLNNVTQTIGAAPGLDSSQKSQLEALVASLKTELHKLPASHADETKEITGALEKAVASAARPPQERKRSLLELSAKGLKDAAELVGDIAPTILTTAGLIAKFIVGL